MFKARLDARDSPRTLSFILHSAPPTAHPDGHSEPPFGLLALKELAEVVALDEFYLTASFGSDGLWHVSEACGFKSTPRELHRVSELALRPLCDCHREDLRVMRMLRELAPIPDLLAQPAFSSQAEASTWAGLFLAVLKTSEYVSESAFQRAVDLVRSLVPPDPLASHGTLVMVERGSRTGMVPHTFRVALQNALAHDPRGASLVLVPLKLPSLLFDDDSLLSPVFHLVSHHAHRDVAQSCAPLTMRLYDNGAAGLTPAEAFNAAQALIRNPSPAS